MRPEERIKTDRNIRIVIKSEKRFIAPGGWLLPVFLFSSSATMGSWTCTLPASFHCLGFLGFLTGRKPDIIFIIEGRFLERRFNMVLLWGLIIALGAIVPYSGPVVVLAVSGWRVGFKCGLMRCKRVRLIMRSTGKISGLEVGMVRRTWVKMGWLVLWFQISVLSARNRPVGRKNSVACNICRVVPSRPLLRSTK